MFVPLHNLYEFVHQVLENKFLVWYFWPPGKKEVTNLVYNLPGGDHTLDFTKTFEQHPTIVRYLPENMKHDMVRSWPLLLPTIVCHDQEPLNFELYSDSQIDDIRQHHQGITNLDILDYNEFSNLNLRSAIPWAGQDRWILMHSEKNSNELKKYEDTNEFVGAFMWSHAFIAKDWYRFAKYDRNINREMPHNKTFLVYALDHTGTRQYRKDFLDIVNQSGLYESCQVGSFNKQANINGNSSASYDWEDHRRTSVSVVLETTFDHRIHLTEKTLRPIACKHPFIIANGPGTLKFLKSYGFKTFSPWINESYDNIQDDNLRLKAIADAMEEFDNLPASIKQMAIEDMKEIAEHNFNVFFSEEFEQQLIDELISNVMVAYRRVGNDVNWNRLARAAEIVQDHNPDWIESPARAELYRIAKQWSV